MRQERNPLSIVAFQTQANVYSGQTSHSIAAISMRHSSSLGSLFNTTFPKKGNNMALSTSILLNDGKSMR